MKRFMLFWAVLLPFGLLSQNLVKNGDFEGYGHPPYDLDEISRCYNWDAGNTDPVYNWPEYYNSDSPYPVGIPESIYGYKQADSSVYRWSSNSPYNAYSGIVTYGTTGENNRTHLTGDFLNLPGPQIKKGVKYYFSIRVSLSDTSRWATGLQIYLSQSDIDRNTNPAPTNNIYHAAYQKPILDTKWVTWAGSFVANADYDGFAIGNFIRDDLTPTYYRDKCTDTIPDGANDTLFIPPCSAPFAYYYIDNVCISENPNECERATTITNHMITGQQAEINRPKITVYPNPATNIIQWDALLDAELINQSGQVVSSCLECRSMDVSTLARGLYCFRLDRSYTGLILLN